MRERFKESNKSLAGSLLLAHPAMRDPNFHRTVVLMTSDTPECTMGVVLNRPLKKRLGELGGDFALGPLSAVPMFGGGPVQTDQLILAAWQAGNNGFQLHLGIEPEKAAAIASDGDTRLRAFFGYAGWASGQLKAELDHNTWVRAEPPADLFDLPSDISLWRNVLGREGAEWRLMADEPDDPTAN